MELDQISVVMDSARWSAKKLEEAARGLVQGSCDDPPEVQLKFWWELILDRHEGDEQIIAAEKASLIQRALAGEFDE